MNNDGVLESLNDKRTSCILLLNGLILIIDHLRSCILSLSNLAKRYLSLNISHNT